MDFLNQEINSGDFVLTMRKGSGWDKSTYFSVDVVVRTTDKTVFVGEPANQKKFKIDSVIVLTREQLIGYAIKHWGEEGADRIVNKMQELKEEILR
jgi:hypothetical protein